MKYEGVANNIKTVSCYRQTTSKSGVQMSLSGNHSKYRAHELSQLLREKSLSLWFCALCVRLIVYVYILFALELNHVKSLN